MIFKVALSCVHSLSSGSIPLGSRVRDGDSGFELLGIGTARAWGGASELPSYDRARVPREDDVTSLLQIGRIRSLYFTSMTRYTIL